MCLSETVSVCSQRRKSIQQQILTGDFRVSMTSPRSASMTSTSSPYSDSELLHYCTTTTSRWEIPCLDRRLKIESERDPSLSSWRCWDLLQVCHCPALKDQLCCQPRSVFLRHSCQACLSCGHWRCRSTLPLCRS
jgi:hypothetical protein